ncbi:MAG: ABC-F family ATP-binding cassette domain-containing protein [Candidatus Shapirobacteria bacterium]
MISAKNIFYSYGKENIFEGANFFIAKNSKVGVVGSNGSGKSTLFKLITGEDFIDDGSLEIIGDVMSVPQEVKQDAKMEQATSVRDYLDPYWEKQDYELLKMLSKLELSHLTLEDDPKVLSGGQKTKLAITRALIFEPEILLLDEPTNFLDTQGKLWMMNFLGRYSKTLIIISHDLKLLDRNINKIIEVNKRTKQITEYNGNYTNYVNLKGERETLLINQIHVQERKIIEMKKGLVRISGNRSEKGVRQKLNLQRRIEKLVVALPEMPPAVKKISMQLPEPSWVGEVPFMVKNLSKSYGTKKVLTDINFDIKRGERIALMGQNGAGKSTLIKILMGMITPDSGEIIKDEKIKIGYYSQEFETFDMDKNLLETVKDKCEMSEPQLRCLLGRFLFPGQKVFQKISTLSGGEKTRLSIATLLAKNYNLLILDEPTTYLDVLSQRLILEALKFYQGAMIIVSHTPEFIAELKPSRHLLLPENKMILCN